MHEIINRFGQRHWLGPPSTQHAHWITPEVGNIDQRLHELREAEDEVTLPLYVASDDALDPATEYALLYVDFDAPEIEAALLKITGVNYTAGRELFWTGHNDTSIIADYFSS